MFRLFEKINRGEIYVIAEMSANHGGKLENALEIVRAAAKAGADCVKIQTYTADSITINCDNENFRIHGGLWDGYKLYDLYTDAGTPYEWQPRIKEECEKNGVDFLSTPFDENAVDFLESFGVEAYKIASFELVDIPLIEYVASKKKPIIISCGMGSIEEIRDAVAACRRKGNNQIVLLKCCSEYPANWGEMHLSNIPDMKQKFGVPVGLSDHSIGSMGAIVGVALGAQIIEKHVKLAGVSSADSAFSMEISDFASMVDDVRNSARIKGDIKYGPTPGEMENLKFRRSLFVVNDINKGEEFTRKNIRCIRPSMGLEPKYYNTIIGKKAATDLRFGDPLKKESVCYDFETGENLYLRKAMMDDCKRIFEWRNEHEARNNSFNHDEIAYENHCEWFRNVLEQQDTSMYIMMLDEKPIGQIRIKHKGDEAEISYSIDVNFRGRGFGKKIIKLAEEEEKKSNRGQIFVGEVLKGNIASRKIFLDLGYEEAELEDRFIYKKKVDLRNDIHSYRYE